MPTDPQDLAQNGVSAFVPSALGVLRSALDPERESPTRVELEAAKYVLNSVAGAPAQRVEVEISGRIGLVGSDEAQLDAREDD